MKCLCFPNIMVMMNTYRIFYFVVQVSITGQSVFVKQQNKGIDCLKMQFSLNTKNAEV